MTNPHGSSRWKLKFHSCTVGRFMCGSNTVIGGEFVLSCCGGVNSVEGFTVGAGNCVGKPPATVLLMVDGNTQPVVIELKVEVVVLKEVVQLCTRPGTRPAAAVTWNDEIVSKAIPYPTRITLLALSPKMVCRKPDLNSGLHAKPIRGPMAPAKLPSYQCFAFTNETAPGWLITGVPGNGVPTMGVDATNTLSFGEVLAGGLYSQRAP